MSSEKFKPRSLMDVLTLLNNHPELLGTEYSYIPNSPLAKVFAYAYVERYKWMLPSGVPPYNRASMNHGESPRNLLLDIRRGYLRYFVDSSLTESKRQSIFIHLIESVDENDVAILLAIKDQTLNKMFPTLTYEVLEQYNYVPHRENKPQVEKEVAEPIKEEQPQIKEEVAQETVKPKRGRPSRTNASTSTNRTHKTTRAKKATSTTTGGN